MSTINITAAGNGVSLVAGQYTTLYAAPAGCVSVTVNYRLVLQDLTQNAKTRVAIVPATAGWTDGTTAPNAKYWVQPVDTILGPTGIAAGVSEDTGVVLQPGEQIVVFSDVGHVTGRVHGLVRTIGA